MCLQFSYDYDMNWNNEIQVIQLRPLHTTILRLVLMTNDPLGGMFIHEQYMISPSTTRNIEATLLRKWEECNWLVTTDSSQTPNVIL